MYVFWSNPKVESGFKYVYAWKLDVCLISLLGLYFQPFLYIMIVIELK